MKRVYRRLINRNKLTTKQIFDEGGFKMAIRDYVGRKTLEVIGGALLLGVGLYGGGKYVDRGLKPAYNEAVSQKNAAEQKLTTTQGLYKVAEGERDNAKKEFKEGLAREAGKDSTLDEIVAKAKELGILPKE